MKPRPKPLLGLVLGLLFGAVVVGLLWQLGVAPPDRFILFGIIGVSIALTELLLTQTTRRGKGRFATVMVIAGLFGGVALTGVPETFGGHGSLSDGCHLEITSGSETVNPEGTEPFDPLDTTPTDTLLWTSSADEVLTNWDTSLGMLIGGIPVTLFTAERPNAEQATEWSGEEKVADYLAKIEDETGLQLRGTFHVAGAIDADEGDCDMAGYIRVNAESAFATPLIVGLWALGAALLVMIVWIASSVGRSVRDARRAAYEPAGDAAVVAGAAGAAAGTSAGDGAADEPVAEEPVGAFTPRPDAAAEAKDASPETVVTKEQIVTEKPVVEERTVYTEGTAGAEALDDAPVDEPAADEPMVDEPAPVEPEVVEEADTEPPADGTEPPVTETEVTDESEPAEPSGGDEEPKRP